VTALETDNTSIYVATRHGVWHQSDSGIWQNYQEYFPDLPSEAQALLKTPDGLWIGTRTGIYLISSAI
jgi:ligand-binding sensor domain-containing protein